MVNVLPTTVDGFLGGKLQVEQPVSGYRAATDPVYLAGAVPAKGGQTVLDVGCGVGVASLCLGVRTNAKITGLEIQSDYAKLAVNNARSNNIELHIVNENLAEPSAEMKTQTFDHVMTNPPFFEQGSLSAPVDKGKSIAHVETLNLQHWIRLCLKRLKPLGTFTIIQRADRLPDILSALSIGTGNITILPIVSRSGQDAKRVLVQSTKTSKAPLKLLSPFVVHSGVKHTETVKDFSQRASEILRDGTALNL